MSDSITIKHRTVMALTERQTFEEVRKFSNLTEEEMELEGATPEVFYFTKESWSDMGEPEQITITVEPGDLLNPPIEGEQ